MSKVKELIKKPIGCLFFGFIFCFLGFMDGGLVLQLCILFFVGIYFLGLFVQTLFNKQWHIYCKKICIWVVAVVIGMAGQFYLYKSWLNEANQVVEVLQDYQQKYGQYPNKEKFYQLLNAKQLRLTKRPGYIFEEDAEFLFLIYASPNMVFGANQYDFKLRQWEYFSGD